LGVRLTPTPYKTTPVKEPQEVQAGGMFRKKTLKEVELTTGKPRKRREWSEEVSLGRIRLGTVCCSNMKANEVRRQISMIFQ
jgi:hypothetical protein